MLVAGEDHVDAVLEEHGLEQPALQVGRAVRLARRIERMMEERDLPIRSAGGELLVEPLQLLLVDVVAVDGEEADAALRLEAVVLLAVHVEVLVEALLGVVMVAERGVELDVGIQQRLVGKLELLPVVAGPFGAVEVVPQP